MYPLVCMSMSSILHITDNAQQARTTSHDKVLCVYSDRHNIMTCYSVGLPSFGGKIREGEVFIAKR
jgi:hypothetical protein